MNMLHTDRSKVRRRAATALLALIALLVPGPASAVGEEPSTYILLLLDTQEQMNMVPTTGLLPSCPTEKSPWISTQEALAGTLGSYGCTIVQAPIPGGATSVPRIDGTASFAADGLLLHCPDSVRFGMMTMDTVLSPLWDAMGGFSYGVDAQDEQGNPINLGARSALASSGTLITFNTFGALPDVEHNAQLREILQDAPVLLPATETPTTPIIPFGSGSLAALLDDARFFFAQDASVKPGPVGRGDPQAACRQKLVFLVSSGHADPAYDGLFAEQQGADSPFGRAEGKASLLLLDGVRTHVFFFDDGLAATKQRMDAIANAGGTGSARAVLDSLTLRNSMAELLNEMLAGIRSQTRTTSTFATFSSKVAQIQVSAAYTTPTEGRWSGHVEFSSFNCYEDRPFESHDFGEILDGRDLDFPRQGSRTILTPIADGLAPIAFSASDPLLGLTTQQLGLQSGETDKAVALIRFMKGESVAPFLRDHALGAVVNSNPQVIGPPSLELPFHSYQGRMTNDKLGFKLRFKNRPTMVYAGGNDGVLHAFAIASPPGLDGVTGTEVFGYVPRALHGSLRFLEDEAMPHAMVDGTPVLRDVRLRASTALKAEDERWITLLLGGARSGGRFYYALNVSDPLGVRSNPAGASDGVPYFLWEMDGADPDAPEAVRQLLGLTYARPAIGSVLIKQDGELNELAVAFIPGGKQVSGLSKTGLGLWVVQIEQQSGQNRSRPNILRTFALENGDFPLVGTPVAYGAIPGQPTSRVFVGDAGGRLWRIDTSATEASRWTMKLFYDPYAGEPADRRRPAYHEPALALRPTGELVVVYGTGDPDNPGDQRAYHRLVSLTEVPSSDGKSYGHGERPNFVIGFQTAEQLTGPPVIFDSTVYFATYRHAPAGACQLGETRLWGVDFVGNDPSSVLDVVRRFPTEAQTSIVNPGVVWQESAPPSCNEELPESGTYTRESLYCLMPRGTRIFGIEISRSPVCSDFFGDWLSEGDEQKAASSSATSGKPVLTVQTGRYLPLGLMGLPMEGKTFATRLRRLLEQPRLSTMPLMWGVVYDD